MPWWGGDEVGHEVFEWRVGRAAGLQPGESRGEFVAKVAAGVPDARFPRGFGDEGSLEFVGHVAALGEEGLEASVGFADVVPAGGGAEGLGPRGGGRERSEEFVNGGKDVGWCGSRCFAKVRQQVRALTFVVVALAIACGPSRLVGDREERERFLGFLAGPAEGGGIAAEGGVD